MSLNWSALPENVKPALLTMLDDAWQRQSSETKSMTVQDRARVMETTGYLLRMYWLGRTDKFSSRSLLVFAAITKAAVPSQQLNEEDEPPYETPAKSRVLFSGVNHVSLSREVMEQVLDAYVTQENLAPPSPPRRGLLSRLF